MEDNDIYHALTGKNHPTDASVLEIAEHGRVGGLSTGEPYKKVGIVDGLPTDAGKNNPSTVLSYDGSGNLQYIDETIGVDVYRTTFTFTGGKITGVSSTVKL